MSLAQRRHCRKPSVHVNGVIGPWCRIGEAVIDRPWLCKGARLLRGAEQILTQLHKWLLAVGCLASLALMTSAAWYGLNLELAPQTPQSDAASTSTSPSLPTPELRAPQTTAPVAVSKGNDPLRVIDPDPLHHVVSENVQALKNNWSLVGVIQAGSETVEVTSKNAEGATVTTLEKRDIWAASFTGRERFYRVGDRLEGTEFSIKQILHDPKGAYVIVEGDTGALVKLMKMVPDRYGGGK